ncbi:hypothetical protein WICMUC_002489 [Wickerhamomyces mucosus]|uniref:Uncharacterized protein n=1 Tax=Wickerhamomyces mucosus TaxID=1378264 RepID=A0A9P8TDT7_9ASCO|nr:hypothetical protein WICMUC_002489 [Wickerhamomyces mucosus]
MSNQSKTIESVQKLKVITDCTNIRKFERLINSYENEILQTEGEKFLKDPRLSIYQWLIRSIDSKKSDFRSFLSVDNNIDDFTLHSENLKASLKPFKIFEADNYSSDSNSMMHFFENLKAFKIFINTSNNSPSIYNFINPKYQSLKARELKSGTSEFSITITAPPMLDHSIGMKGFKNSLNKETLQFYLFFDDENSIDLSKECEEKYELIIPFLHKAYRILPNPNKFIKIAKITNFSLSNDQVDVGNETSICHHLGTLFSSLCKILNIIFDDQKIILETETEAEATLVVDYLDSYKIIAKDSFDQIFDLSLFKTSILEGPVLEKKILSNFCFKVGDETILTIEVRYFPDMDVVFNSYKEIMRKFKFSSRNSVQQNKNISETISKLQSTDELKHFVKCVRHTIQQIIAMNSDAGILTNGHLYLMFEPNEIFEKPTPVFSKLFRSLGETSEISEIPLEDAGKSGLVLLCLFNFFKLTSFSTNDSHFYSIFSGLLLKFSRRSSMQNT